MNANSTTGHFEPTRGDALLEEGGGIPRPVRQVILLAQAGLPDQHVELKPLATAIGECIGIEISLQARELSEDLSGSLYKVTDTKYRIDVNDRHPVIRRRFTIAHELAHFLLHKDEVGDGITEDLMLRSEALDGKAEWEANCLAAAILIPRSMMERAMEMFSDYTPQYLAGRCKTPRSVAQIRLGSYVAFSEMDKSKEAEGSSW